MARPRKDGTAPKTAKAKAADVEKPVETVETTNVVAPVEEPIEKVEETQTTVEVTEPEVEEVAETDEVAADETPVVETPTDDETETPTEETTAEDTPTEVPTEEPKKKDDAPKATKKKKVAINGIVQLNGATTIYRGPGVYPFAKINGVVSPLEDTDESGYTKVQCVISGSGACTGYVKL